MTNLAAPRVLLINNDARHFVTHRLTQARLLEARGYAIDLAVPLPSDAKLDELPFRTRDDRSWFQSLRKHSFPLNRQSLNPVRESQAYRALAAIVARVQPQIVHSVTPKGAIYGSLAARNVASVRGIVSTITGLGFVFSSRAAKARLLRPIAVGAYRRAFSDARARVIFQNPEDRGWFIDLDVVRAGQARLVAGSGVDVEHFAFSPETDDSKVRAVFIGRMLTDKGVRELVEAARLARAEEPRLEVHLIGDADPSNPGTIERGELEAWAREGAVRWHGAVADVRPFLASAHIAVLPSHREGVPMALLEAAACGRAMVATNAPGCRNAVSDGTTGLLAPVNDPRALADALIRLARDRELRRAMGAAARARAEAEFSKTTIADQVADVYKECLGGRAP